MTIYLHEIRQGRISLAIWTFAIAFLLGICVFLFPEIQSEMGDIGDAFASMGSFTAAFGMDRLNFGTLIGYYAIECGNVLGLGGALYASLAGILVLSKEEKDRTAEFLFSHPVSRTRVLASKLAAVLTQVVILNAVVLCVALVSVVAIGEEIPWEELLLMHAAYFILQIELACVCFGLSAFLQKGSAGVGLGLAFVLYFLNLIANMTDSVSFLKYFTPFGYCEAADIIENGCLDTTLIALGMFCAVVFVVIGFWWYRRKDIR